MILSLVVLNWHQRRFFSNYRKILSILDITRLNCRIPCHCMLLNLITILELSFRVVDLNLVFLFQLSCLSGFEKSVN